VALQVGCTCLSSSHPLLVRRRFDVCLVDEASQVTVPVVLGPIMKANSFVLVGDPNQLPPLVSSVKAQEGGLGISLLSRLLQAHPQVRQQ
jgi:DNA replication ATP-dependent helicase Dna2